MRKPDLHAIARINTFDETKLHEAEPQLEAFNELHASQPGYAGSITIDLGAGRQLVLNLWRSQADARAGLNALRGDVQRVLDPIMTLPSQLIGAGPVTNTDLVLRPGGGQPTVS